MKLIAGLGNPGPKYETTRHNAGFLAIDRLIEKFKATGPNEKHQGLIWQADVAGEKVLLVKPQTYMNLSGRTVGPLYQFYKLQPTDLVVIHDEVDLPINTIRIKTGGGTGGHNGLKSIEEDIGSKNNGYHRIRVGVGRPTHPGMDVADYVLGQYTDQELQDLDKLLDQVTDAARLLIQGKALEAMNRHNRKGNK